MTIEDRYADGTYLTANADWHQADAAWKAAGITGILKKNGISPNTICDVGCGTGDVLAALRKSFHASSMTGFDISPQVERFWDKPQIRFIRGDLQASAGIFDVLLMLDVFEHVRDPFTLLESARAHGRHFVFHIPLDLSAMTVARGLPLIRARRSVGHLHFYTRELALETLTDCGYAIDEWQYTHAAQALRTRSMATALADFPRRLLRAFSEDLSARVLGGETLLVLAH